MEEYLVILTGFSIPFALFHSVMNNSTLNGKLPSEVLGLPQLEKV